MQKVQPQMDTSHKGRKDVSSLQVLPVGVKEKDMNPEVTKTGILDMQVCVPESFTDDEVKTFADTQNPSGTKNGWQIRRQGSEHLAGADERVKCVGREGCVHVMLDC